MGGNKSTKVRKKGQRKRKEKEMHKGAENVQKKGPQISAGNLVYFPKLSLELREGIPSRNYVKIAAMLRSAKKKANLYSAKWESPKRLEKDPEMTEERWYEAISNQYEEWYQDASSSITCKKEGFSALIPEWQQVMLTGHLPGSVGEPAIMRIEEELAILTRDSLILQVHRYKMKGEFLDTYLRSEATDMAYIDAMIMRYLPPADCQKWFKDGNSRDAGLQNDFQKGLICRYKIQAGEQQAFWCPVSRQYHHAWDMTATHLVSYNIGETNCDYMFGAPKAAHRKQYQGHSNSPSNGLFIHEDREREIDNGSMIIVPASKGDVDPETKRVVDFDKDKEPYKVRVLNPTLLDVNSVVPIIGEVRRSELDGRILQFQNNERPRKRYLWFLAITKIVRRRRCCAPGWHNDIEALRGDIWASPGAYIRKSTMYALMRRIAFVEDPEAILKLGPNMRGSVEEGSTDVEIADRVAWAMSPPIEEYETQMRGEEGSPPNGTIQSRVLSDPFRQTKVRRANGFTDWHSRSSLQADGSWVESFSGLDV